MEVNLNHPAHSDPTPHQLKFLPNFSHKSYELFEVSAGLLDELLSGRQTLQIKSFPQGLGQRSAALCTTSDTFRLKKNESSNTMVVVDAAEGLILKQTQVVVELERTNPNKHQLVQLVMQHPILNCDNEKEVNKGVGRQELLEQCQMSEGELLGILRGPEKFELFICEAAEEDHFAFFDPMQLFVLIDALIITINQPQSPDVLTVEHLVQNNGGVIKEKFLAHPLLIDYALRFICDEVQPGQFQISTPKLTKAVAQLLLIAKGDFFLPEFIVALKNYLELSLPFNAQSFAEPETPDFA